MKLKYRGELLPFVCPYCTADFCNQFALQKHFKVCQARRDEPEEP